MGRVVWTKTLSLDLTAGQGEPLAARGARRVAAPREEPGRDVPAHPVLPPPARRLAVRGPAGGGRGRSAPAPSADDEQEQSYWDGWEENEAGDWDQRFENRDNPCHPAYYQRFYDHDIRAARNVLVSDLGLMAKAGEDDTVHRLRHRPADHRPHRGRRGDAPRLPAADARAPPGPTATASRGSRWSGPPFLATVRHGGQTGYLRLDGGSALPMAHFDVAGTAVPEGPQGLPLRRARDLAARRHDAPHVRPPRPHEAPRRRPPGALRPRGPPRPARADA